MSKTPVIASKSEQANQRLVLQVAAWCLSLVVAGLAFVAWGHDYAWQLGQVGTYQIFPLLGLVGFSLMWGHYVMGMVRELAGIEQKALSRYFRFTSYVVLFCLCLHPGLLIYQRFRDGHGLPPKSYESYVAHGLGWVTILGSASLLVFLSFEFHRVYGKRSWWHYVADASDFAMLAVFYHSIRLGSELAVDNWFRTVWYFYGLSLVVVLTRKYYLRTVAKPGLKAK